MPAPINVVVLVISVVLDLLGTGSPHMATPSPRLRLSGFTGFPRAIGEELFTEPVPR